MTKEVLYQEVQGAGGGVAEGGDVVRVRAAAGGGRDEAGAGLQVIVIMIMI